MPRQKAEKRQLVTNNNTIKDYPMKKVKSVYPLPIPKIPETKGGVLVCGMGDFGQLGLGPDRTEARRPLNVPGVENAVEICAGGMHTLVLTSDGRIFSFGCNDEGALGRDTSEEDSEFEPRAVELNGKAVKISAGDSHSACLLDDGRVLAWGSFRNLHGNMGLTLEGNKRVPCDLMPGIECCSIASGVDHLVILTCNGHVFTVGNGEQGQLGRVTQRSASGDGRRGKTELLRPARVSTPRLKLVDRIWATNSCTFVHETFGIGRILAFGLNNYKQLICKRSHEVIASPTVIEVSDVKTIAGGEHHTLILKNDGSVHVVGRRDYGRLGLGAVDSDVQSLSQLEALRKIKIANISCGQATSFAVTPDGELYVWGMGSNHQLGTNSEEDVLVPQRVEFKAAANQPILRVASGGQHSVFIVKQN